MRYITVPVSKDAQKRLDYDECSKWDTIDIYVNEADTNELFQIGLADEINNKLDLLIDEFESEEIVGQKELKIVQNILRYYLEKYPNSYIVKVVDIQLINALRYNTGVYFFF